MIIYNPNSYFVINFINLGWVRSGDGVNDIVEFVHNRFHGVDKKIILQHLLIVDIGRPVEMAKIFPELFFFVWS